MSIILKVENLNKIYVSSKNNSYQALNGVNLKIHEGEFISIMGASGSGKSTLLYNISGMDSMTSGSVIFDGISINKCHEKKLAKIRLNKMGFVFQKTHFLKSLNILDNILLPGFSSDKNKRSTVKEKAVKLIDELNIDNISEKEITEVSGGQLQRAAICRALINDPKIIFGDEPTGALNSKSADDVMNILKRINADRTTIMLVTHDSKVAAKTERVLLMSDGEIVEDVHLGKFENQSDLSDREKILNDWLVKIGA